MLIDRLEKIGRLVMWLVISGVLIIAFGVVPLQIVKNNEEAAGLRDALKEAQNELKKTLEAQKDEEPKRLPLKGMGLSLSGMNYSSAVGKLWFTNVSPRRGVVCVEGTLTNNESGDTSSSVPGCSLVDAYSTVSIDTMFAGGEISRLCPQGQGCSFSVNEVQDSPTPAK